ncbi:MAG: hypothetical protein ABIF11_06050 [Nitrospirota bacterium]
MSFEAVLQAWSIVVLVIVAGVFVVMVWSLIKEIRKSVTASCNLVEEIKQVRKLESMPYVLVDIKPKETQIQVLEVVIRNIGEGCAFNFNCKFTPDILYREKPKITISDLPIFKNLKVIPPKEEIKFFFASAPEYMNDVTKPKEFEVFISYEDSFGETHNESAHIDLAVRNILLFTEEKGLNDVAKEVERLTREICWMRRSVEHGMNGYGKATAEELALKMIKV